MPKNSKNAEKFYKCRNIQLIQKKKTIMSGVVIQAGSNPSI
jgi:hypothetical protein